MYELTLGLRFDAAGKLEQICDYCGQPCAPSFKRIRAVSACQGIVSITVTSVRCDPLCQTALDVASKLRADLEKYQRLAQLPIPDSRGPHATRD